MVTETAQPVKLDTIPELAEVHQLELEEGAAAVVVLVIVAVFQDPQEPEVLPENQDVLANPELQVFQETQENHQASHVSQ